MDQFEKEIVTTLLAVLYPGFMLSLLPVLDVAHAVLDLAPLLRRHLPLVERGQEVGRGLLGHLYEQAWSCNWLTFRTFAASDQKISSVQLRKSKFNIQQNVKTILRTDGDDELGSGVVQLPGDLLGLVGGVEGGEGEACSSTAEER